MQSGLIQQRGMLMASQAKRNRGREVTFIHKWKKRKQIKFPVIPGS